MLKFLKAEAQRFMKYMRDERGFLEIVAPLAISAISGALNKKSSGSSNSATPQFYNTLTPGQQAVDSAMQRLLTQGADPYNGQRVAGLTSSEQRLQSGAGDALDAFLPALTRILSGQFGPEQQQAFDQGVADPMRRQFNLNVRPEMRENAAMTGNRFADRTAIAEGRAVGELESGIAQSRAQAQQQAYYAPGQYGPALTGALQTMGNTLSLPRQLQQQQLDVDFSEFMRINPNSGGLLSSMMSYINSPQNMAVMPQGYQTVGPGAAQAGAYGVASSMLGRNAGQASDGQGSSTTDALMQLAPYFSALFR